VFSGAEGRNGSLFFGRSDSQVDMQALNIKSSFANLARPMIAECPDFEDDAFDDEQF